ncbi:MAG: alpha-glucan family phosphorylase [Desulfocapsaceae bacterium]|nr:alpha-glucan family phosphorylase [Desulfocapsaceae bacterium]
MQTQNNTSVAESSLLAMLCENELGRFFGIKQEVFNTVWKNLTAEDGNSVAYISMEIGADPDVYNPLKKKLQELSASRPSHPAIQPFVDAIFHGPQKIPNYSGGLGILAGDTLKSFADCHLPVVAISLLYRYGYFSQIVDSRLGQLSQRVDWSPEDTPGLYLLRDPQQPDTPLYIEIPFLNEYDQETIATAKVWMKIEISEGLDFFIPELLLDFFLPETPALIKNAARQLYDSESSMVKAMQRRMLGTGIIPVLQALGITSRTFHLNEQHGVVVAMQLIAEELYKTLKSADLTHATDEQILAAAGTVAQRIVYTIHTPVKAGHDRFDKSLYAGISHKSCQHVLDLLARDDDNPHTYNFTNFAMRVNRSANSVSRLHRDVTHKQFPQFANKITAITNGVHHLTWISDARANVFDRCEQLNGWRQDPGVFRNAAQLMHNQDFRSSLQQAWKEDTRILFDFVNDMLREHRAQMVETWIDPPNYYSSLIDHITKLNPDVFTIGFARRFSTYKRADLIFNDIDVLTNICVTNNWPVNFLFAGKAHPADEPGKTVIKHILGYQEELYRKSKGLVNLIFIPNYDMSLAKMLVAGVHAWLNNPKRPLEASGTSGMKAAMNGVPNISIMDGWWVEGYHYGQTGWKFGHEGPIDDANLSESREEMFYKEDSDSFYRLLPLILRDYYHDKTFSAFLDKGIMNLCKNVPIFNTHRMAAEYLNKYDLVLPDETKIKMRSFAQLYSSDS